MRGWITCKAKERNADSRPQTCELKKGRKVCYVLEDGKVQLEF